MKRTVSHASFMRKYMADPAARQSSSRQARL
ncbi:MAG: hypothetical protein FD154_1132 [Elusimicrobia bacterium]|nr:MAG: hypothetical protein FD154_1132 [Elusimicrobiota bacterium]